VHNCFTQHSTVFPFALQAIVIAQMMSTGGVGKHQERKAINEVQE